MFLIYFIYSTIHFFICNLFFQLKNENIIIICTIVKISIPVLTIIPHPNAITSNISSTNPNILQETLLINSAPMYTDPGASAADPEDGNISNNVAVSGDIVNMAI